MSRQQIGRRVLLGGVMAGLWVPALAACGGERDPACVDLTGFKFSSASGDDANRGVFIWRRQTETVERWATVEPAGQIAVGASGQIALIEQSRLYVREPSGEIREVDLDRQAVGSRGQLALSPDGSLLHTLRAREGIATIDVATGVLAASFIGPQE